MRILAIDQGTTSTRAVAVEESGAAQVLSARDHRQSYPHPGWVEHDPEELLRNVAECISAAGNDFAVVGIDNQGESCLAWNRQTGEAVSPVIVWQDERTEGDNDRLRATGAEALTLERAGLHLDPYFSASKLGWILRNAPEAARLAASGQLCLGTTDAFFRHRLTGRFETDVATASRTSLMNLATCAWDADLCALFGVPMECLPTITPTCGEFGAIAQGGLPLTASIVDQQAALRGQGCSRRGDAKITFGTGAFVLAVAGPEAPAAGGGPVPTIAWSKDGAPPVYALEGGVHAAAAAVNWARGLGLFSAWSEIDDFARPPAISRGIAFVPALAGLACPHWDRRCKGTWMGMGLDAEPTDMVQAVLEGIAFRTAEVVRSMDAFVPIGQRISIDGGMTRNPWFCQFVADCLGREVRISRQAELTAVGTAILAAEAVGLRIEPKAEFTLIEPGEQPEEWAATFQRAVSCARSFASP
ncbi:FGGY family carbohydrate kinase [Tropicimonas isoalkanivorans]|uniref:ATP:glycerol 3-phosphotransferase n=1 Tax=Tropicimonas isoalkanivorans TaxID=441112 RepID=A0A1I1DDV0_9RHOB|nr:FGGY family carbohydrate kinase [Tropicimonas isoalkanivorans]SFB73159.1 glycerol kinase [Tropicimonas isoalkanivorans]